MQPASVAGKTERECAMKKKQDVHLWLLGLIERQYPEGGEA
jgi:hypothetical protein